MWVAYAFVTVICWGLYGAFLNKGAIEFQHDRMKAFLFVGLAYVLIGVIIPLALIAINGKEPKWEFKSEGIWMSLFAGILGAVGGLTALFALNTHPLTLEEQPAAAASQVMSLVFAGAPIIAATYGLIIKPPKDGFSSLDWRFIAGLVFAAAGGCLVTLFRPS